MAKARVIDFTKPAQQDLQTEKYTEQVIKAKEIVSDTLDLLFSKDSKLRSEQASAESSVPQPVQGEIKIGELKLRGPVQLPQRKVIMNEQQLGALRRNLALFSCWWLLYIKWTVLNFWRH